MTEKITIKKMRNKANAKRIKERYKRDYINRFAGEVVYASIEALPQYVHPSFGGIKLC